MVCPQMEASKERNTWFVYPSRIHVQVLWACNIHRARSRSLKHRQNFINVGVLQGSESIVDSQ